MYRFTYMKKESSVMKWFFQELKYFHSKFYVTPSDKQFSKESAFVSKKGNKQIRKLVTVFKNNVLTVQYHDKEKRVHYVIS